MVIGSVVDSDPYVHLFPDTVPIYPFNTYVPTLLTPPARDALICAYKIEGRTGDIP